LIVWVRGPAIFRKLFAELFRTLFDFGGTGGGSLDLEQIFKDGLALLSVLFNCCRTIPLPTAAATKQPLLVSLFRPRGGGVGGGLEVSILNGTGGGNFEVDDEPLWTFNALLLFNTSDLFS